MTQHQTTAPTAQLLGGPQAQAAHWALDLQGHVPSGTRVFGWNWDGQDWQYALSGAPCTCLLLLHLDPQRLSTPPSTTDGLTEQKVRDWLTLQGWSYRLFFLDLLPGEESVQTRQRLLRALGYTALEHPNNHAVWSCNGCSDPDCERRSFSRLLPAGQAPHPAGY